MSVDTTYLYEALAAGTVIRLQPDREVGPPITIQASKEKVSP